jgi:hypothetical protein
MVEGFAEIIQSDSLVSVDAVTSHFESALY